MKKFFVFAAIMIVSLGCKDNTKKPSENSHDGHNLEQTSSTAKPTLSPHKNAMAMFGDAHVHIDYSSPSVRGRIIFGGLLAYGAVWQSGAHNATWIETNTDLLINETVLKAGKYGFFTIPEKEKWTVIFNTNWEQHGKDEYDQNQDVLRFEVAPEFSEEAVEQLIYQIEKTNDQQGSIALSWEKTTIRFPFSILN